MQEEDLIDEKKAPPRVAAVFEDIRATRGEARVNNFWRALARDPDLLEATWKRLKGAMGPASEGGLDPLTKELVYLAISITNGCLYCVHCHTRAARKLGMTETQYADLLGIVALASQTSALASGLRVPVDREYLEAVE